MTVDIDRSKQRAKIITEYLHELDQLNRYSSEEILEYLFKYRAAERLQELIIHASLDLGRHLLKEACQLSPKDNADVFGQMSRVGFISVKLSIRLKESAKFRNVLAHFYDKVEPIRVVAYISDTLRDYPLYVVEIQRYLSELEA